MPFARIGNAEIYFEQTGTGPDLLIISGTGSDLRLPRPPLPNLENHFRILRYDHRGLGQSTTGTSEVDMGDFADDVEELLNALDINTVDVIGISFGGMVAQHFAIRHPEKIEKLVLACTSPGGASYASADLLALMELAPRERQAAWLRMYDIRYSPDSTEKYFVYLIEKLLSRTPEMFPNAVSAGLMRQLRARADHDTSTMLEQILHPCLIVGGKYDRISPPENLHYLAKKLPRAALQFFEGGHSFLWEDDSAWKTISAFLRTDDGTL